MGENDFVLGPFMAVVYGVLTLQLRSKNAKLTHLRWMVRL